MHYEFIKRNMNHRTQYIIIHRTQYKVVLRTQYEIARRSIILQSLI